MLLLCRQYACRLLLRFVVAVVELCVSLLDCACVSVYAQLPLSAPLHMPLSVCQCYDKYIDARLSIMLLFLCVGCWERQSL